MSERFALAEPTPDAVAVIYCNGVWFPFHNKDRARELAREIRSPGVWMRKP